MKDRRRERLTREAIEHATWVERDRIACEQIERERFAAELAQIRKAREEQDTREEIERKAEEAELAMHMERIRTRWWEGLRPETE